MTFDIIYHGKRYQLTLDEDDGTPLSLLEEQPHGGPPCNVNLTILPPWLLAKVQDWWEGMQQP